MRSRATRPIMSPCTRAGRCGSCRIDGEARQVETPVMAHPFHTIGHGRRPLAELAELLQSASVTLLVDVRTVPRSRTNPQYNRDSLPDSLAPFGIGYQHIA